MVQLCKNSRLYWRDTIWSSFGKILVCMETFNGSKIDYVLDYLRDGGRVCVKLTPPSVL